MYKRSVAKTMTLGEGGGGRDGEGKGVGKGRESGEGRGKEGEERGEGGRGGGLVDLYCDQRMTNCSQSERFLWGGGLSLGWGPILGEKKSYYTAFSEKRDRTP